MTCLLRITPLLCLVIVAHGQDGPVWDALDRYRETPICLLNGDIDELMQLPGIGRMTASRIVSMIEQGLRDIHLIVDTLCLSTDQRIMLLACTGFDCDPTPLVSTAMIRSRWQETADDGLPRIANRMRLSSRYADVGGVITDAPEGPNTTAWISTRIGPVEILGGDMGLFTGRGLVFGSAAPSRTTIRTQAFTAYDDVVIRPWTSAIADGASRGVAIRTRIVPTVRISSVFSAGRYGCIAQWTDDVRSIGGAIDVWDGMTAVSLFTRMTLNGSMTISSELARSHGGTTDLAARCDVLLERSRFVLSAHHLPGRSTGLLAGITTRIAVKTSITSALRLTFIPTRRHGMPLPTRSLQLLAEATAPLGTASILDLRGQMELEDDGLLVDTTSRRLTDRHERILLRVQVTGTITKDLRYRCRIEGLRSSWQRHGMNASGVTGMIDLRYSPATWLSLSTTAWIYDSRSLDAAPYAFEVPAKGFMRTIPLLGQGSRLLATMALHPASWADVWCAYGVTTERASPVDGRLSIQVGLQLPAPNHSRLVHTLMQDDEPGAWLE